MRSTEPVIRRHARLELVPEPAPGSASVFEHVGEETRFFVGTETDVSYECGGCGSSLIAGVPIERISGLVLKCAKCEKYNLTTVAEPSGRGGP
jgi:hypothetical protein